MKIALIGQSAFGKAVLEALTDREEHDIVGVFAAPNRTSSGRRRREPLATAAEVMDIPVWQFKRMRDQECIDVFRSLNADLCVMAYVTDIVPNEIIDAPSNGTIQYHPSLLPLHRGPSSINWAIIHGDTETGLSIFWPDEGLDTGPILMQKRVEISSDDSVGSLYFNHLFPMGIEALVESVGLVATGNAPRIVQDENHATYEGWCGSNEAQVDWSQNVNIVHNLIRGCDPQPGAWTRLNDEKVSLFGSTKTSRNDATVDPGTILEIDGTGMTVSTDIGSVKIKRVRIGRGPKNQLTRAVCRLAIDSTDSKPIDHELGHALWRFQLH